MPKITRVRTYDLRKKWTASNGDIYRGNDSLYAWYQFDQDVSVSGDLQDLSGNSRDLGPLDGDDDNRPQSPTADVPFSSPTRGFPTKSAAFSQDGLSSQNSSDFLFVDSNGDKPFTLSAWVKFTNLDGTRKTILSRYETLNLTESNFSMQLNSSGYWQFYLLGESGAYAYTGNSGVGPVQDVWYNIVFSYDGRGGSQPYNGVKHYVNGEIIAPNFGAVNGGTYTKMSNSPTSVFTIGNVDPEDDTRDFDGNIAQVAVWDRVLSPEEVSALYNGPQGSLTETKSGYLTNPVRTIIRENDYRTGSYPMNVRTGDPDFSGKSTIGMSFDDTAAVDFVSPFAQGSITIQGGSALLYNHWVGLTGSTGGATQDFEFIVGSEKNRVVETSKLIVLPLEYSYVPGQAVAGLGTANPAASPVAVAQKLSDAINEYKDQLFIRAYAKKNVVHLKCLEPLAGVGNIIVTGSSTDNITPLSIKQFSITSNGKVRYPIGMSADNQYANQNISTPNALPDLESYSDTIKGISDYGIHFTPGENISPFSDDRITLENTQFYASGTDVSVVEGFTSPLRSKTQLVFNLNSSNGLGTHLFYSTGSPGPLGTYHPDIAGKYGSGFSYWNDQLKRWDMINAVAGNEPRWNQSTTRLTSVRGFSSPMYFGPTAPNGWHRVESSYDADTVDEILERYKGVVHPVNTSGFPSAQQYNATGSQCLTMKDFISSPFLLEKIRVEFKGNLGLDGTSYQGVSRLSFRKFFVLAQPTNGDNPHTQETESITAKEYENGQAGTYTRTFTRRGKRELIAYGRICLLRNDTNFKNGSPGSFQSFKDSFEKVIEYTASDASNLGLTSSFSMDVYPKLALNNDVSSFWNTAEGGLSKGSYQNSDTYGNYAIDGNENGGADLLGNPSGRQIATSLDIADLSTQITGTQNLGPFSIKHRSEYSKVSPYLLFPEDNIIFGWENIPEIAASDSDSYNAERMVDRITDMKITFFGSLVRDNKEYHEGLNQPLTSDGIHEAILGAPLVDQWDVEPITILSGSTRDALFFGDMFSTSTGVRGRRGSVAAGDAGNTGSLNRNVHFLDKNVIYADSRVPSAGTLIKTVAPTLQGRDATAPDASVFRAVTLSNRQTDPATRILRATNIFSKRNVVSSLSRVGNTRPLADSSGNPNISNNLNFPYLGVETTSPGTTGNGTYNIFSGGKTLTKGINASNGASSEIAFSPAASAVSVQNMNPSVIAGSLGTSPGFSSFIQEENQRALNGIFFGAPLVKPYLGGIYAFPILPNLNFMLPWLRGLKFGFFNLYPTSPVYHFRRNSFGQMRDLIETPPEGKMVGLNDLADYDNGEFLADQNAQTAPVKVVFMSRSGDANISPLDTNTQNLSQFCTSSEPYYDGESRERDIEKDPPPDLIGKTIIEEAVQQIIDGDA